MSIYHGLRHHHSYLSTDCGIKLNAKIYSDSKLSKQVHCGRTKSEAIVKNVLGPKSVEMIINDLKPANQNPVYFSIASDASNKGNQKLFPIAVRYFTVKSGIQDKLLDFVEDSKEAAEDIFSNIEKCLKSHQLKLTSVSSYSADNAPVNYGIHKSVFKKLSETSPGIVKANCCCHVIHNAGRKACAALSFDIETLVLKVYAEFSTSAKNLDTLKSFFEDFDLEYHKVIRHVATRWLSLFRCVNRLILNWPALKSYFISIGKENCEPAIWRFIDDEDEVTNDLSSQLTFPEIYLYFVHHYMNVLTESILILEKKDLTSIELHDIMCQLREKIKHRLDSSFYGARIKQALIYLTQQQQKKFISEANKVYTKTLDYLNDFYDFDNSYFQYFSIFDLKTHINYDNVLKLAQKLVISIDEDKIFDEIGAVNSIREKVTGMDIPIDKKWCQIFESLESSELVKIVSKVLSIPISNAFVERIFSIMNNLWTEERNNLSVPMVKAELCVRINYNMNCNEFLDFITKSDQRALLESCKKNTKYDFKFNDNDNN